MTIPTGALVVYHGSLASQHGLAIVLGSDRFALGRFILRTLEGETLRQVRPGSFTVTDLSVN